MKQGGGGIMMCSCFAAGGSVALHKIETLFLIIQKTFKKIARMLVCSLPNGHGKCFRAPL